MSVPDPLNRYHEMKHKSAITPQNELEFWGQKVKVISHSSLRIVVLKLIFLVQDLYGKIPTIFD